MTVILLLTLATAELIEYKSLVSQSPTASASVLGVYLFMELGVIDGGDVPYCVPPQELHVHKHLLDCSEWGGGGSILARGLSVSRGTYLGHFYRHFTYSCNQHSVMSLIPRTKPGNRATL